MFNTSDRLKLLFPKLIVCISLFSFCIGVPLHAQQSGPSEGLVNNKAFDYADHTGFNTTVYLLANEMALPKIYAAHIATGVCSDGLCKPVDLMVYWDLLGNFNSYQTTAGNPLTKFDHIEFTEQDHEKLREILADKGSMLKDYEAEDMVDKGVKVHSKTLDAVTGATSKTFQDVIVPGAVYTVHTLWHIVNGPLSNQILEYTRGLMNKRLVRQMLTSNQPTYKDFVFKNISREELRGFTSELIALIGDEDPFVPHFAMAKLEDSVWNNSAHQESILRYFSTARLEVKNFMLDKFSDKQLTDKGLTLMISAVSHLNKVQKEKLEGIIENNKSSITEDLEKDLTTLKLSLK